MFRNLEAEQRRFGFTNNDVAIKLGVSRITYEKKKKNGKFNECQIKQLMKLFNCTFDYLFASPSDTIAASSVADEPEAEAERHLDAIQNGKETINTARAAYGLQPIEEGDSL